MSATARRTHRRALATELRNRRRESRAHRDATTRVKVSDFLISVGVPTEEVDRFGSWAGRRIVSEYRSANHGHEPRKTYKRTKPCKGYPKGRCIKVNVYRADDPALIAGARKYNRTAPYVAEYAPAA